MGLRDGLIRMLGGGGEPMVAPAPQREQLADGGNDRGGQPGTRVTGELSGAGGGNGTITPYSMAELNLLSRADARVLGRRGIAPVLNDPAMDRLWDDHTVDVAGEYTVLDFQRIILSQLVLTNEAWVWRNGGSFEPLPAPTEIRRDPNTKRPTLYRWRDYEFPIEGLESGALPAEDVLRFRIRWFGGQDRGIGLARCIAPAEKLRTDHMHATVRREIMLAVYHLALRTDSAGQEVDAATDEATQKAADEAKTQTLDVTQSQLWELGSNDSLEVNSSSAPPVGPLDVEKFLAGWLGQAYGLSRLAITGDASDSNYTSSRYANEMDAGVWARYQEVVVRATLPIWDAWPGNGGAPNPEWSYPPPIVIDPVKQAAALRTLVESGIVSRSWARRQLGANPARMQQEIDDETGASPAPPPPAPEA